ncbi:MAG: hypothetical protein FWD53_02085 [Phycisphaerales bacterium]|nr:hypothetical protein [Phycisphaerales bacterium]
MKRFSILLLVFLCVFLVVFMMGGPGQTALAEKAIEPLDAQLRNQGVDPADMAVVKSTAKSNESFYLRELAIRYLASQNVDIGDYLSDKNVEVRITVAELLFDAGSEDGMAVMVKDFKQLTRSGIALDRERFLKLRDDATRDSSLIRALEVAKVLAKGGDMRGLKLATLAAVDAPLEAQRYRAVWVLEESLRQTRKAHDEAMSAFSKAASTEPDHIVINMIVAAMLRLQGEDARTIIVQIRDRQELPPPFKREHLDRILARMSKPESPTVP